MKSLSKIMIQIVIQDSFLKYMQGIRKNCLAFIKILHFYQKEKNQKKVEKLVCCIEEKEKHVVHIKALNQALNHGLKVKNVLRVSQFKQQSWLKPYIDMNTELGKKQKMNLKKISLS